MKFSPLALLVLVALALGLPASPVMAKPAAKRAAHATAHTVAKPPVAPSKAAAPLALQVLPGDRMLGDPKAKVTIIEYGSVACPICARFNASVMPDLKAKYITTGKVRYIFRPMLTGVPTVAMAGTRLAECVARDRYFDVVDSVMKAQAEYYAWGENNMLAGPVLVRIAASYGLDEATYNKCVVDPVGNKTLNDANKSYILGGVTGTPTFFINGKRMDYPVHGMTDFDAAIAAAQ